MTQQGEIERIRACLRRRERLFILKIVAMLIFGFPLSFLAPLILSSILWAAAIWASTLFYLPALHVGWAWLFWPLAILMVPLFYVSEIRTGRAKPGEDAKPQPVPVPGSPVGTVKRTAEEAAIPASSPGGFVDIFLVGARMVVSAGRQVKAARHAHADHNRAAAVLHALNAQTGGLETSRLLREGEQLEDLEPVLRYLSFHQWIDIGAKHVKVWLYSAARQSLRPR